MTLRAIRPVVSLVGLGIILAACNSAATRKSSAHRSPTCLQRTTPPLCYSPLQLRRAYDVQPLLDRGITGKGRTIVVIAGGISSRAHQVPFSIIRASLHQYDRLFHLPDSTLTSIAPFGGGLAVDTAYELLEDIEVVRAIAPRAAVAVVISHANTTTSLTQSSVKRRTSGAATAILNVIDYALTRNLGDVISLSYGLREDCYTPSVVQHLQRTLENARAKRVTVTAGSGDYGALGAFPLAHPCSPRPAGVAAAVQLSSSSPLVLSVGGTTLHAMLPTGAYRSEIVWREPMTVPHTHTRLKDYRLINGATGGGPSHIFQRPAYQGGVADIGSHRSVPDVSFEADPNTGVATVLTVSGRTAIFTSGGTSAGAPAWAGIVALADQYAHRRLGFLNPALYRIGRSKLYSQAFHDIVSGNNSVLLGGPRKEIIRVRGIDAHPGWDAVTGWGTPKVATLVPLLARFDND